TLAARSLDEALRLGRQQVGRVALVVAGLEVPVPVELAATVVGEIVDGASVGPVELGEALVQRMIARAAVAEMPLPQRGAMLVSCRCQSLGERNCRGRKPPYVVGVDHSISQTISIR